MWKYIQSFHNNSEYDQNNLERDDLDTGKICVISSCMEEAQKFNWDSEVNVPKSAPIRTLNKSVTLNKKYRIRLKTYYFISLSVCLCWLVWISQAVFIYLYCLIIFVNKCHWFVLSGLQHCLLLGILKKRLILVPSPKIKPKFENYFYMLNQLLEKKSCMFWMIVCFLYHPCPQWYLTRTWRFEKPR